VNYCEFRPTSPLPLPAATGSNTAADISAGPAKKDGGKAGAKGERAIHLWSQGELGGVMGGEQAACLKPYQLVGVNFLSLIYQSQAIGGCILADEVREGDERYTCMKKKQSLQAAFSFSQVIVLHPHHLFYLLITYKCLPPYLV
jgi:hypothetical protein